MRRESPRPGREIVGREEEEDRFFHHQNVFWPRMKMTGEKEPREREDDRVANGDDWLSGRKTGDIRVNYGQPQDLLVSR